MIRAQRRAFSAMLTPSGVHVVSYRDTRGGLQVLRYGRAMGVDLGAVEAAEALAEVVLADGGRGGRLALAVAGFGGYHHLLSLPPAPREILAPIVLREFRRFFPDLFTGSAEPVIDFVEIGSPPPGVEPGMRELLAAAVPAALIATVRDTLAERGIELTHWTIVPRALQRLYEAFVPAPGTDAALLAVPGSPLLGLFHEGELRLFSDLTSVAGAADGDLDGVLEQIERGALFVRQQFRGSTVGRLLLAADPEVEMRGVAAQIRERLPLRVDRFGPYSESPGAMAALGAALDADAPDSLNLLPPALRPADAAHAWVRRLGVGSALVVALAGAWWGWSGVRAEMRAEHRVQAAERALRVRGPELARLRSVIEDRREHAQRAALLHTLDAQRQQLPDLLWPIREAAARMQVLELRFTRSDSGWEGVLRAAAMGQSSAGASAEIDHLYRVLSREFPDGTVTLEEFGFVEPAAPAEDGFSAPAAGPIAIAFRMSFILPASPEDIR